MKRDQASSLRLLIAAKKLKEAGNYTAVTLGDLLREHGYTKAEYFELIEEMKKNDRN